VHLDSSFLGFKPTVAVGILLSVASDHLDFVASSDHAAGHFVRASAARHFGGVKVLVEINDAHNDTIETLNLE
jgi:hypothetical protein